MKCFLHYQFVYSEVRVESVLSVWMQKWCQTVQKKRRQTFLTSLFQEDNVWYCQNSDFMFDCHAYSKVYQSLFLFLHPCVTVAFTLEENTLFLSCHSLNCSHERFSYQVICVVVWKIHWFSFAKQFVNCKKIWIWTRIMILVFFN